MNKLRLASWLVVLLAFGLVIAIPAQQPPLKKAPIQAPKLPIDPAKLLKPNIVTARVDHSGGPAGPVDLGGTSFGSQQAGRRVLMDGKPALSYEAWSNTSISIQPPANPIKWYHEYLIVIDDGAGKVLSNEFRYRFPICWDGVTPNPAAPGTEVTLYCWGPGPSLGTKILRLDAAHMQVTGWSGTGSAIQIKAIVPPIAPGPHKIFFMDGASKISQDLNFTVL